MKTYHSISIPKPCYENWDKMIAEDKGRFCQSCSKSVIDFTKMPQKSIEDYLANHKGEKICGRFKSSQLAEIRIEIPHQIIQQQPSFHKLFLLALLITMGTSLLNCSDKNGNTKKIDAVEVIDTLSEVVELPKITTPKVVVDSTECKTKLKKQDTIGSEVITVPIVTGLIIVEDIPSDLEPVLVEEIEFEDELEEEIVIGFPNIDRVPEFKDTPTGQSNLDKKDYMSKRISEIITKNFNTEIGENLDLKGKQRIWVQFKINKNGNVSDIKTRAPHPKLKEEAERVINLLPKFILGQQRNKNVAVVYSLPIVFVIED